MEMSICCSGPDDKDETGVFRRVNIEEEVETTQPELPKLRYPAEEPDDDDDAETPLENGAD